MTSQSPTILLVGADAPLLEGLSQSLAALGFMPRVTLGVREAREIASVDTPLVVLASSRLAAEAGADVLRIPLLAGGALVLYHGVAPETHLLSPALQRAVLANLALPLERHRLVALVQHVLARSRMTGRRPESAPPSEHVAP